MGDLPDSIRQLYDSYGQRKPMGSSAPAFDLPHYFLLRTFLDDNDLLVILNTKRCRYKCWFCQLPEKSSRAAVPAGDIIAQFGHVAAELRHALSIIDRVTLSNEGSILDQDTLPESALFEIVRAIGELRRVRTLVIETRLEFLKYETLEHLRRLAPRIALDILTGFESVNPEIRESILHKQEPLTRFENGLDVLAKSRANLTAYVLYKPTQTMSDSDAFNEAQDSIEYLRRECLNRKIPLTVRLNPMYLAEGSRWSQTALRTSGYMPPRLSDVLRLAQQYRLNGLKVYVGLSTEGLNGGAGTYMARDDFSPQLLKAVLKFNSTGI